MTLLDEHLEISIGNRNLRVVSTHLQMHRTGCSTRRFPKRSAQHVGQPSDIVDVRIEFRGVIELREIFQFLVRMAVSCSGRRTAGQCDHRRTGKVCITQTRSEVGRPHMLRHANAWLMGSPRVTVGHVCSGFFAVRHDAPDAHAFHGGQRL